MEGSFKVCILLEEQSRYFKLESRLMFRISREFLEQISFSSAGMEDRFKDERLQSLQFNSFSPEKREKLNSLRKLEAIFNFLREEVLEKLISVEFPKKLEEDIQLFQFFTGREIQSSQIIVGAVQGFQGSVGFTGQERAVDYGNSPEFSDCKNIQYLLTNRQT